MNTRLAVTIALAAGTPVGAQEIIVVPVSWTEMIAGTNTPILAPNGLLEPGEGALIQVGIHMLRNGTSAIGQVVTMTAGSTTITGPIRGIGGFVYDLTGTGSDVTGTWNSRIMAPLFNFFPNVGIIMENGARIHAFNSAQIAHGGAIIDGTNPITSAWRGVWNPASYTPRIVHFDVEASDAVPVGQQNAVNVERGIEPGTGYTLYHPKYFDTDFGAGIDIPIGPGSSPLTAPCYPNCDTSTGTTLDVSDVMCYLNLFIAGSSLANCDGSIRANSLTANDLMCYLNKFAAGCS
jgi:hypothetical protein